VSEVKRPTVVLKFGSSVLRDREMLPEVVSNIYRVVRSGRRVVAVTSAFMGVTDALLGDSVKLGCPHDNVNAPSYIATGEEASAALVSLACDRSGLCSIALKTPELGILAEGPIEEATPVALKSTALLEALDTYDVVVVPGFVATDARGRTVLLGRGGSDLTAIFLADALRAERVRLVKDVDGVYDRDPARAKGARRFERTDWATAKAVAGRLVQTRALEYARVRGLVVEVGAVRFDTATIIGPTAATPTSHPHPRRLRVALAGYGVVGAGVAARLLRRPDAFDIVGVLVRDSRGTREGDVPRNLFVTRVSELLETQPDVVVDALSCASTGLSLTENALRARIDVVSANKQAVAAWLRSPSGAGSSGGARLLYSAAVGGSAPLLETVAEARAAGAEVVEIAGILNGTVNFILGRLARGVAFETAIEDAKRAGLAEANPNADLSGADAAAKLNLIAIAAFGSAPRAADVQVTALDEQIAAGAARRRLKQVARLSLRGGSLIGSVTFEPADGSPFADLSGDRNAIRIVASDARVWTARGRGAGRWPTTESVFADLLDLAEQATCEINLHSCFAAHDRNSRERTRTFGKKTDAIAAG